LLFIPDLNVGFTAYYGNIGPTRPTDLVLDPAKAPDLTKYLRRKRLTLAQFEAVRAGTYQPAVDPQQPNMPPSLMEIQVETLPNNRNTYEPQFHQPCSIK